MIPENQGEYKALHFIPGFNYGIFQAIHQTTTLSAFEFLNIIYSFILKKKPKTKNQTQQKKTLKNPTNWTLADNKGSGSLGMVWISRNRSCTEFDAPSTHPRSQ